MKRLTCAAGLVLAVAACNAPETGLVIRGVGVPDEMDCSVEGDGEDFLSTIPFDSDVALGITLPFRVRNDLNGEVVNIGSMQTERPLNPSTSVTPLDFDARWECNSNGFSGAVGPLFLPAFSPDPNVPFCLDEREDVEDFRGFDLLPATGASIEPGEFGVVAVQAIPSELGQAIDEFFILAALADQCCVNSPGCSGEINQNTQASCGALRDAFASLDPSGNLLTVESGSTDTTSEDVARYAAFARFYGSYISFRNPPDFQNSIFGPSYTMKFRGFLEGITADGSLVRSSETSVQFNICKSCGVINTARNGRVSVYEDADGVIGEGIARCLID